MNEVSDTASLCARLKLPQQDLSSLSFCATKPSAVKAWAESLPATRAGHTSVLLYKVLPEFSRLNISAEKRLEMLEALRPFVQGCIEGLSKNFLNQPLLLTDAAIKAATVAQALQKHMSNAYTVCTRDFYQAKKYDAQLCLHALHRTATGLGLMLMRSYQLYTPVRGQIWHELHSLYLLAEEKGLLAKALHDPLQCGHKSMSFEQVYMRALLLACVRPNQLRQQEVAAVYHALESWSEGSKLVPSGEIDAENLHLVCLDMDSPPTYRTRYRGALTNAVRELDNDRLLQVLKDIDGYGNALPSQISATLLQQLIQAWDLPSLRNFERLSSHAELAVCVGLSNVCSHLSGMSVEDNKRVVKSESSHFNANATSAEFDPWDDTADAGPHAMIEHSALAVNISDKHEEHVENLPTYTVTTLDSSPGGYCLNWREKIPTQARVGEVISIKERQRSRWNIAVIRWVQQSNRGTQMGVQLLAPMAEAVEIAMINKMGDDSRYMRGLLLPALKAANQPASLLCASMPFHEHCKVYLKRGESNNKAQLTRKLFATSSLSQFSFRIMDAEPGSEEIIAKPASNFDENW